MDNSIKLKELQVVNGTLREGTMSLPIDHWSLAIDHWLLVKLGFRISNMDVNK